MSRDNIHSNLTDNMEKLFLKFIIFLLAVTPGVTNAQNFANEIADFNKADSIAFPFLNQPPIVFVGSSSFRRWENVQASFPGYPIINRGFGGSVLADVIRYREEVIFRYHPKQVVIYCGENDLASDDSVTAKKVLNSFKELFGMIRNKLPQAAIAFISIKPSPSRRNIQLKVIEANALIKNFMEHKTRAAFIDVYHPMLNKNGTIKNEIFTSDSLHMNAKGYVIWQKKIKPFLLSKSK
ncbi:MAG: GDSL-type esterase/lipase family protein [Ferruginibacter sp.]